MRTVPPRPATLTPIAALGALALLGAPAAHAAQGGFSFGPLVVAAADANADGAVDAEEWRAFTDGALAGEGDARGRLVARVVSAWIDADGDRSTTAEDVEALLAGLDTDGDGDLEPEEQSGFGGRGSFTARLGVGMLIEPADANADGTLQADEREALLAAARASTEVLVRDSIAAVRASGAGDRSALTPAVVLLSLEGALDVDRDRSFTEADLARLFGDLDANGDGVVSAEERNPRRRGRGGDAPAAPTYDRSRPPLVPWQRSLGDALALSRSTGKPLLICVNMDGESASESLAWGRYRDPEFVELVEGFVPLIVSPDRHGTLERDDRGRRLPDPRFGRVLESEHVDIEPIVFERYFNGNRVAPRHVGVAPNGEILFDVYLVGDLREVDEVLAQFGVHPEAPPAVEAPPSPASGERASRWRPRQFDFGAPVTSTDAADREVLEASFVAGDWRTRFELASTALATGTRAQHPELLRMALRDPDERVRRQAVYTAARVPGKVPADLMPEVLRESTADPVQRGLMVASLARLARTSLDEAVAGRAARLFAAFSGLARPAAAVDVDAWRAALAGRERAELAPVVDEEVALLVDRIRELTLHLTGAPDDAAALLEKAEKLARLARLQIDLGRDPSIALEDARASAAAAEAAGAHAGRAAGVLAFAAYQQSDMGVAADAAARALPQLLEHADSETAAEALQVLARTRTRAVYGAMGSGEPIEAAWVSDVRAAHDALAVHPLRTEGQTVEFLQFLDALEVWDLQDEVVRRGLESFPDAAVLHSWLRGQLLRDQGAAALEAEYAGRLAAAEALPATERAASRWFAALAYLVAAERRVGILEPEPAAADYERAAELFRSVTELEEEFSETALHYLCLARAGSARLHLEAQRLEEAVRAIREAVAARPESADARDGLGGSPAETARRILDALAREGRREESRGLRQELGEAGVELNRERTR